MTKEESIAEIRIMIDAHKGVIKRHESFASSDSRLMIAIAHREIEAMETLVDLASSIKVGCICGATTCYECGAAIRSIVESIQVGQDLRVKACRACVEGLHKYRQEYVPDICPQCGKIS